MILLAMLPLLVRKKSKMAISIISLAIAALALLFSFYQWFNQRKINRLTEEKLEYEARARRRPTEQEIISKARDSEM